MKKRFINRRKEREGTASFKPNHAYIAKSVKNFLNDGGKINQIILDEKSYRAFVLVNEPPSAVDEFLSGQ